MVQFSFAAGALLLGALLLVTVAVVRFGRDWRPARAYGGQSGPWRALEAVNGPAGWSVLFLILVGVALAGGVLFVSGPSAVPVPGGAAVLLGGVLGLVTVLYFFWGVYSASRYRGLHKPAALAVTLWMVGMVVLATVVARLLGVI